MHRRAFIAASVAAFVARPAAAAELTLDQISGYLNSFFSAKASFTQVNYDGTQSSGRLLIRRPGRMRFEYAPPDESIVIAGQGTVAVFDDRSNEPPTEFQLGLTPLKLILSDMIDLRQERMVTDVAFDGTETIVTLQDPKHPEYGALRLHFADPPKLTRWTVVDGGASETTVILSEFETGMRLPNTLFDVREEMEKRGF